MTLLLGGGSGGAAEVVMSGGNGSSKLTSTGCDWVQGGSKTTVWMWHGNDTYSFGDDESFYCQSGYNGEYCE